MLKIFYTFQPVPGKYRRHLCLLCSQTWKMKLVSLQICDKWMSSQRFKGPHYNGQGSTSASVFSRAKLYKIVGQSNIQRSVKVCDRVI